MKRKSMDDPAKALWRDREKAFIRAHKHQLIGEPKDWNVIFLPGHGAGLYPTEIETFESLGVKRHNMVGLENDEDVYPKLKSRKLGIDLRPVDAKDFFEKGDAKFDIISLDFDDPFNINARKAIKDIANFQRLKEHGILYITTIGRREAQTDLDAYFLNLFSNSKIFGISDTYFDEVFTQRFGNYYDVDPSKITHDEEIAFIKELGFNMNKLRDNIIFHFVSNIFCAGMDNYRMNPILKRNPSFCLLEKMASETYIKKECYGSVSQMLAEYSQKYGDYPPFLTLTKKFHMNALAQYLKERGYDPFFAAVLLLADSYPYFLKDSKSYKYHSSRGTPMLSNFFLFDQHREILDKYIDFAKKIYINLKSSSEFVKETFSNEKEVQDYVKKVKRDFDFIFKILEDKVPERIYLGSSSKRPDLDGETYYKFRIESEQKGKNRDQLWKQLKHDFDTDNGQLRAFERHFNMETYGPKEPSNPAEPKVEEKKYKSLELFNSDHPYGFLGRLPKATESRLKYFVEEDLPLKINMTPEQKDILVKTIAESKWYKTAEKLGADCPQICKFFDDIMLYCIWNNTVPNKNTVSKLLENALSGQDILPERPVVSYTSDIKNGGESMSPRGRPYISKEAALTLLSIGKDPQEIAREYRGYSPGQLRAFKAHITMDTYSPELTRDLAYELFATCGLNTEDVRTAFPKESSKRIGAYKAWHTMRSRE